MTREIPDEWKRNQHYHFAEKHLNFLFSLSKVLKKLVANGAVAIDLGCGSPESHVREGLPDKPGEYEAWFLRACYAAGAKSIGVDVYPGDPNDLPYYKHVTGDVLRLLHNKGLGSLIRGNSPVAVINANGLLLNIGPTMNRMGNRELITRATGELMTQAGEILTPGGVLCVDYIVYLQTQNNGLYKVWNNIQ